MKFIYYKELKTLIFFILITANIPAIGKCNMDLSNFKTGPWDYYDAINSQPNGANRMGNIKRVTNAHLTQKNLQMLRNRDRLTDDLDYTLRAIPNHPDALNLASRLERMLNSDFVPQNMKYEKMTKSADCYFQRALKLRKHAGTYEVYAIHFHRNKKYSEAKEQHIKAMNLGSKSANSHYNHALTLIKLEEYQEAEQHAKIAYKLGYPLPGLRKQLQKHGYCKSNCQ